MCMTTPTLCSVALGATMWCLSGEGGWKLGSKHQSVCAVLSAVLSLKFQSFKVMVIVIQLYLIKCL